jgi:hypothetical protein
VEFSGLRRRAISPMTSATALKAGASSPAITACCPQTAWRLLGWMSMMTFRPAAFMAAIVSNSMP